MNEQHYGKTDLEVPESLKRNIALLEEAGQIGFFYYGPRLWMVGEVEPLKALQDERLRAGVVKRILDAYPRLRFGQKELFYRLRKAPEHPAAGDEYDSPPDSFLGTYRFDSPCLPILYASQDLEVCVHECRVTVEDDLYVALPEAAPIYQPDSFNPYWPREGTEAIPLLRFTQPLALTAPASRERVAPIVFRPPRRRLSRLTCYRRRGRTEKDRGQDPPRCVNTSGCEENV